MVPIFNFSYRDVVCLYILGCLFICYLNFVEILGFDDLVLKCYFLYVK